MSPSSKILSTLTISFEQTISIDVNEIVQDLIDFWMACHNNNFPPSSGNRMKHGGGKKKR